jgi:glycosyltransferase involved in cell wall biosynthesis
MKSEVRPVFITTIGVVHTPADTRTLAQWLTGIFAELKAQFADFELIIVNNGLDLNLIEAQIKPLEPELRQHVFLLNLSTAVDKNNALLAGLDRANGDYTIIFEFDFAAQPALLLQLWDKTRENADIVYLRARDRPQSWLQRLFYRVFYFILKRYSGLHIDPKAYHSRIISRRALNSVLRLRENSHYLKANYALVGYNTAAVEVEPPPYSAPEPFGQQFRNALLVITSFTNFLRTLMLWMFLGSVLIAGLSIFNAVKVKITKIDLLGSYHETMPGWAFLVVMLSVFFAIICFNLYIISIYLSNIYAEIKNRPLYIVESVRRY